MPFSFLDQCIIQAMSNPDAAEADASDQARDQWALRVVKRARALSKAREAMEEKMDDETSERVNKELEHRSAIS